MAGRFGPNYAANNYDGQLEDNYARFFHGPLPDLRVRLVQVYLRYQGFSVSVDGRMGPQTASAISAFQKSIGDPPTGTIDNALIDKLTPAATS